MPRIRMPRIDARASGPPKHGGTLGAIRPPSSAFRFVASLDTVRGTDRMRIRTDRGHDACSLEVVASKPVSLVRHPPRAAVRPQRRAVLGRLRRYARMARKTRDSGGGRNEVGPRAQGSPRELPLSALEEPLQGPEVATHEGAPTLGARTRPSVREPVTARRAFDSVHQVQWYPITRMGSTTGPASSRYRAAVSSGSIPAPQPGPHEPVLTIRRGRRGWHPVHHPWRRGSGCPVAGRPTSDPRSAPRWSDRRRESARLVPSPNPPPTSSS